MTDVRLRVLLVDDEPLVRQGLRSFLEDEPDVEVVGEARDGREALQLIVQRRPSLVFLDVQMPELDGVAVAEALAAESPAIVFVTAYDRYAVRAFDLQAVDYLLKPFDRPRFQAALERARRRLAASEREVLARRVEALLLELGGRGYLERIPVRSGRRIVVVPVDEVEWFEAADNYVRLHAGGRGHLLRETIKRLETRLDPRRFARIHRSAIVNLDRVRELQPLANGEYAVFLGSGTRLILSRTYRDAFQARIGRLE
ncbi:MAG TPA: LytTR family DNA-binding domain-containing protein [Gemmatimonadales bacterium]|nr:LytTR family DNA-binding domain-containing protein [Gemmatimonadales bacterium]